MQYRAKDGDVLDDICARYYGDLPWTLDLVLAANVGLAARRPIIDAGTIIELPDIEPAATVAPTVRLWD